jgi:hypothetical protein
VVKLASQDLSSWKDGQTVVPSTSVGDNLVVGLVSEDWQGLGGAAPFTGAAGTLAVRGTQQVKVTTAGYHPLALVDNTLGSGNIINGTPLISGRGSAVGKLTTSASTSVGQLVASANLPATGLFSLLTNGTQAQANAALTVASPTIGDVYKVTVQVPYQGTLTNPVAPGTAQTYTSTLPALTAGAAASTSAAAVAIVNGLAADPVFSKYYTAVTTSAVAIVVINPVPTAQFLVTYANPAANGQEAGAFYGTLNGSGGNGLSFSTASVGTGTVTAAGATTSNGTGYVGTIPVQVAWTY